MTSPRVHAPGSPCWFELACDDLDAAKAFYGALLGWTAMENPMPDGSVYVIFQHAGRDVAAAYALTPGDIEGGRPPPHWDSYFAVADCDASVAWAQANGGKVLAEPMEVMDHLRMAVLADAEGAVFCLAQLRQHAGVAAIREQNSVAWVELATRDLARASAFYSGLLGWTLAEHAGSPDGYRVGSSADGPVGGLMQMTAEWGELPSHWAIYLQVADVDAAVAKAQTLGGTVHVPPLDAPGVGRLALLADPSGASFYVITFPASV